MKTVSYEEGPVEPFITIKDETQELYVIPGILAGLLFAGSVLYKAGLKRDKFSINPLGDETYEVEEARTLLEAARFNRSCTGSPGRPG